jgi:hypothetical protein
MDIRSFTCWTEPLHFQFPPTKNLRASRVEEEWKLRKADLEAAVDASFVAALERIMIDDGLLIIMIVDNFVEDDVL